MKGKRADGKTQAAQGQEERILPALWLLGERYCCHALEVIQERMPSPKGLIS